MKKQKNIQTQERVIKTGYPISESMQKIGKKYLETKSLKSEIVYKWKKNLIKIKDNKNDKTR